MSLLRFGGKDPQGNAKGINVDDDGNIVVRGETKKRIKDEISESFDRIIEKIGAENIRVMLPMWEDGDIFEDYLNPNVRFERKNNTTVGHVGPYGMQIRNTGAKDGLQQLPITEQPKLDLIDDVNTRLDDPLKKLAVRIPTGLPNQPIGYAMLSMYRVGNLPNAKVRIRFVNDSGGVPSSTNLKRTRFEQREAVRSANDINVLLGNINWGWHGMPLETYHPIVELSGKGSWMILEYEDATGVDANNYIQWRYTDTPNNWGNNDSARAYYDSSLGTWNVTEGSPFGVRLFTPDAMIPATDWTVIIGAKASEEIPTSTKSLFRLGYYGGTRNLSIRHASTGLEADVMYEKHPYKWRTYNRFSTRATNNNLYGFTFSSQKALNKYNLYSNGELISSIWGVGRSFTSFTNLPLIIGSGSNEVAVEPISSWTGDVGPFILLNKECTEEEVNFITNTLNLKNRA